MVAAIFIQFIAVIIVHDLNCLIVLTLNGQKSSALLLFYRAVVLNEWIFVREQALKFLNFQATGTETASLGLD